MPTERRRQMKLMHTSVGRTCSSAIPAYRACPANETLRLATRGISRGKEEKSRLAFVLVCAGSSETLSLFLLAVGFKVMSICSRDFARRVTFAPSEQFPALEILICFDRIKPGLADLWRLSLMSERMLDWSVR